MRRTKMKTAEIHINLTLLAALSFLSGCAHQWVTVPLQTAGSVSCATLGASGKIAAETVKAAGKVVSSAIENPDGAAAAGAMIP